MRCRLCDARSSQTGTMPKSFVHPYVGMYVCSVYRSLSRSIKFYQYSSICVLLEKSSMLGHRLPSETNLRPPVTHGLCSIYLLTTDQHITPHPSVPEAHASCPLSRILLHPATGSALSAQHSLPEGVDLSVQPRIRIQVLKSK